MCIIFMNILMSKIGRRDQSLVEKCQNLRNEIETRCFFIGATEQIKAAAHMQSCLADVAFQDLESDR